jgi:hypothetical protein
MFYLTPATCLRKYVIHMMVEMQFGFNTYCQLFDAVSACDRELIQFVIQSNQANSPYIMP